MKKQDTIESTSATVCEPGDLLSLDPSAQRATLDQALLGNAEVPERLRQQRGGSSLGRAPEAADGRPVGPYLHVGVSPEGELAGGLGLLHADSTDGGKVDILSANAAVGILGEKGSRRVGARGDIQVFNANSGNDGLVGGDFGIAGAGAEASVGEDGAAVGAQASVLQGGVRFGDNDPARANDTQVRIGAGLGGGASGRLHWTDTDGDGSREYGFGADVGPISIDLRSEDPMGAAISPVAHLVGEETGILDADTNLTDAWLATAADAWDRLTGEGEEDRTRQAAKAPD